MAEAKKSPNNPPQPVQEPDNSKKPNHEGDDTGADSERKKRFEEMLNEVTLALLLKALETRTRRQENERRWRILNDYPWKYIFVFRAEMLLFLQFFITQCMLSLMYLSSSPADTVFPMVHLIASVTGITKALWVLIPWYKRMVYGGEQNDIKENALVIIKDLKYIAFLIAIPLGGFYLGVLNPILNQQNKMFCQVIIDFSVMTFRVPIYVFLIHFVYQVAVEIYETGYRY